MAHAHRTLATRAAPNSRPNAAHPRAAAKVQTPVANAHLRPGVPPASRPRTVRRLPKKALRCAAMPRLLALSRARAPWRSTPLEWHFGGRRVQTRHLSGAAALGGKKLCVLATEVDGRWSEDVHELVRQLVCVRALGAPRLSPSSMRRGCPPGGSQARTVSGSIPGAGGADWPSRLSMR